MEAIKKDTNYDHKYKTRNGWKGGQSRFLILDQDIPEALQGHVIEPNVTQQLLDLNYTSMSFLEKGSVSTTQRAKKD